MNDTFTTIVVPLDLKPSSERAVAVAGALASIARLPVHLVTVSTDDREELDKARLHQSATAHGLTNWETAVLGGDTPARSIAEYVSSLDRPLIVMASPVHGAVSEWLAASTVAQVLSEVACPVLVLGPHVDPEWRPRTPRSITCAEPDWDADAALGEVLCWVKTFDGSVPWFVEVIDPDSHEAPDYRTAEGAFLSRLADRLAASGVRAEWEVLHDDNPVDGLLSFADEVPDAVFVVTTERWADPVHVHAHSVSRRLAHRSSKPVLVVPHACVTARSSR